MSDEEEVLGIGAQHGVDMPIDVDPVEMCTLSEDTKRIHLELPAFRLAETGEPVRVRMRFDAETIDGILERLTVLRRRMSLRASTPA